MPLAAGSRIGAYEVIGPLGQGGMGEVFRARDTTLGREVAIKTLATSFANDSERIARLSREARVLAALNHPNIGAIYGVEVPTATLPPALILELVAGDTLDERLEKGPLPIASALDIACQIAEAIDFAHERGVVHRDLKPANIKITPEGRVKVLDFGIAKALGGEDGPDSPVETRTAMTREGMTVGTPAYMSPEQARGESVDRRSDIWAFGCVLFEMLSGRRAFAGPTTSDTIAAVLERQPDFAVLPPSRPPRVRRVLRRCLEKDRARRLRDIADARADLTLTDPDDPPAPADGASRFRLLMTAGGVLLAATLGYLGAGWMSTPVREPQVARVVRLTNGPLREFAPAISPDRKWVAYLATDASHRTDVWVRFIGGGEPINLTQSAALDITANTGIGGLAIAPEGNRIAVMAKPRGSSASFATWELPAPLPGVPRKLLDNGMLGARWSPDGRRLTFIRAGASAGDALWVADADGNNPQEIIPADAGIHIHWPLWSTDRHIYFNRTRSTIANLDQSDIYRVRDDGGAPEPVVTTPRRAVYPVSADDGALFFASDGASVDLGLFWRGPRGGTPVPLTRGVGDYSAVSLSQDGKVMVAALAELRQSLTRFTLAAGRVTEQAVTDGYSGDLDPTMTARGNRLVFSSSRGGSRWLWSAELDGSSPRPLTSGDVLDQWPSISPDGSTVAFVSDRGGRRGIWLIPIDGGTPRRLVDAESIGGLSWTRDGRDVIYAANYQRWPGLFRVAVANGEVRRLATEGVATDPAASPTADVVAYLSPRTTGAALTELKFVDLDGRPRFDRVPAAPPISAGFSNGLLAWSPDGTQLAIVSQNSNAPSSIWLVEPAAHSPQYRMLLELAPAPRLRGVAWAPDGRSIVVGKHNELSDIVLIELQQ